ncbi:MAG: glycosyltransferase family 39 protein, partial [Chloroflexi bacterium]|nr:glycosyltransferase family 39 protein [Chloroflexota bacterium]
MWHRRASRLPALPGGHPQGASKRGTRWVAPPTPRAGEEQNAWDDPGRLHHLPSPARGRGAGGESAHTLALLPILGLAALLRLAALPRRGLIFWDEAKFALEGMRVLAALQIMAGRHVLPSFGKAIGSAKPTHALLFALAYALLGVHDYVPLLVDALASVAEVALTCLIASRLFSPVVGLIAALFLAVSQYDVLYARSALSENDATLLLLAGVLALVPDWLGAGSSRRRVLAAALLLGVGFTTNYRLIVYIAAVIAFDLARSWHAANLRS